MSAVAQAAAQGGVHQAEAILYFVLLQLSLVVLAGRVGSSLAVRLGQSAAVGEIVIGILLFINPVGFTSGIIVACDDCLIKIMLVL